MPDGGFDVYPGDYLTISFQLDEIIKDPTKVNLLAEKVDQLLMAIYFQYRMAFNRHMVDDAVNKEDVVKLYRLLSVVLLSVSDHGELSVKPRVCKKDSDSRCWLPAIWSEILRRER